MDEITVKTKTGETRTLAVAHWAQVRWTQQPVLIHPLTGDAVDLHDLSDTELDALKQRSFDHFSELLIRSLFQRHMSLKRGRDSIGR